MFIDGISNGRISDGLAVIRTTLLMSSQNLSILASRLLVATLVLQPLRAATITWTGAGGNGAISNPANWNPAQAPVNGDVLIFAGSGSLAPQLSSALTVGSITFNSTAGAFVLGGAGAYRINSGVTNNSISLETIGNGISRST